MAVTTGSLTALAGPRDDSRLLQVSAPVQPGNSGGPLLDGGGNVIGVVTGTLNGIVLAVRDRHDPAERQFRDQGGGAAQLPRHQRDRLRRRRAEARAIARRYWRARPPLHGACRVPGLSGEEAASGSPAEMRL